MFPQIPVRGSGCCWEGVRWRAGAQGGGGGGGGGGRGGGGGGGGGVGVWRSEADEGGKSGSQSGRKGCAVRRFVLLQLFINGRAQRVLADERRHCPLPLMRIARAKQSP